VDSLLTQNSTSSAHPIDNARDKKREEGEKVIFIHRFTIHFSFASVCDALLSTFLIKLNFYSLNFLWSLTEFLLSALMSCYHSTVTCRSSTSKTVSKSFSPHFPHFLFLSLFLTAAAAASDSNRA
jgi:hypothetical protein